MVEDANSLLLPKRSFSSILIDSQKSSLERVVTLNENGTLLLSSQNNSQNSASLAPSAAHYSATTAGFKRNNSRYVLKIFNCKFCFSYGAPIDESAVKMVYKIRSQRLNTRVRITDR